ncbi:MAG TPA: hypothetical protein H9978_02245 [Candidatus Corynebacterium faecipullorum]|nr:hypothetical protein [Candidatus Corynebacterium faecipullorum]
MKKYLPLACAPLCLAALSGCSILQPPDVGPQDNIVVSSSEPPTFEAKDVDAQEVTSNLAEPVKDEGLNVEFELQGLYSGGGGTVLTVKIHNLNEVAMPVDALPEPTLERADGNGGWATVDSIDVDPAVHPDVAAPGLDHPLGAGASTNLQYVYNVAPGNLWNARFSIGNVRYVGDLNL